MFWLAFSISMFLMLGAAITKPLNNLIPQHMAVYTLVWICLYGGLWFLFCFLERKFPSLEKVIKCCLPIYFIIFGAALFVVSCLLRCEVFTEYGDVYNAAMNFALGQEVTNWEYFARWSNNIGTMLFLAFLFFLGRWLPAGIDLYYFVLLINVIFVLLLVYCLYYLTTKIFQRHPIAVPLMTLAVCMGWIPFFANTSIFYSDQLSLAWGVIAITLLVKGYKKRSWVAYFLAAGLAFGIGGTLKVTATTIAISLGIACFLFPAIWKEKVRLLVPLAGCLAFVLAFSCYTKTLPYQEHTERLKAPVEYWFALGLVGSGTCADSWDFVEECLYAENLEVRTKIARQQIADEIENMWDVGHIIAKARQNFGCGDLGAAGYLLWPKSENFLWNWFSQDGIYFWKYACITTAFFFSILFYNGVGGLLQFLKKQKEEALPEEMLFFLAALAFWGLCMFMMLWEAQDKFLYNHSGWMIIGLISGLNLIGERAEKIIGKKTNERTCD